MTCGISNRASSSAMMCQENLKRVMGMQKSLCICRWAVREVSAGQATFGEH